MQRRTFLKSALATGLGLSALHLPNLVNPVNATTMVKKPRISVQLYSVREAANKNLAGTLNEIAKMGYDGVEFAGYYGYNASDIRKMLDDCGLVCSGTHTLIDALRGDNFQKTIDFHKTLGTQFIIVPGGINKELHTVEGNKAIGAEFNDLATKAKAQDMVIGYHAHGGDAKLIEGVPAWERFASNTCSDVLLQMDIGNYMGGGGDPYAMIEKFPGRGLSIHIKECGSSFIGKGKVDWPRVWNLCENIAATQWYVVEEETKADDFSTIRYAIQALKEMGK